MSSNALRTDINRLTVSPRATPVFSLAQKHFEHNLKEGTGYDVWAASDLEELASPKVALSAKRLAVSVAQTIDPHPSLTVISNHVKPHRGHPADVLKPMGGLVGDPGDVGPMREAFSGEFALVEALYAERHLTGPSMP